MSSANVYLKTDQYFTREYARLLPLAVCGQLRRKRLAAIARKAFHLPLVMCQHRVKLPLLGFNIAERLIDRRLVLLRLEDLPMQRGDLARDQHGPTGMSRLYN